jgi:hypothetical protein
MEVLEILGKDDRSGHRVPIRMSKTTGFPGRRSTFPKKGGGGGGVKNAESPGKTRFEVVKPPSNEAHFGRNRSSFGAFERILIESERESGQKGPLPRTS